MVNFTITAEILTRSLANFQTHEFVIYAMRHRMRADNLTLFYSKKHIEVSFMRLYTEFRHNMVKAVCRSAATLTML